TQGSSAQCGAWGSASLPRTRLLRPARRFQWRSPGMAAGGCVRHGPLCSGPAPAALPRGVSDLSFLKRAARASVPALLLPRCFLGLRLFPS
uniref:Uncharacterized protein n=1 Tax=Crocodylus porosus TaxID=8502 RepID=A0A7M4ELC8_CROPO